MKKTLVAMLTLLACGSDPTSIVTLGDDTAEGDIIINQVSELSEQDWGVEGQCLIPKPSQCKQASDCHLGPCQANPECLTVWKGEECARLCQYDDLCPDDSICFQDACCDPDCSGKMCGDNGCGGTCGLCPFGYGCTEDGQCDCVPDCDGKDCGPDGCSGSCGSCGDGQYECVDDHCECQPSCVDKECGSDGCGGLCGECPQGPCNADGMCVCVPSCPSYKECGDDGCGGSCGTCTLLDEECVDYKCECVPDCGDNNCGPDGCYGKCGSCGSGTSCYEGKCVPDTELNCADGIDNDLDSEFDCKDDDCKNKNISSFVVTMLQDPDATYADWEGSPYFISNNDCQNVGSIDVSRTVKLRCNHSHSFAVHPDLGGIVQVDNSLNPFELQVFLISPETYGWGTCWKWEEILPSPDYDGPPDLIIEPFGTLEIDVDTQVMSGVYIFWKYQYTPP